LSFEKNEESKEKPVYVGVDDDNSKVSNCFTRFSALPIRTLSFFFAGTSGLFFRKTKPDTLAGYG
jgi:hypothetical protein